MNDDDVIAALDSDDRLVVIEAPAGCGKTYQGAAYAARVASSLGRGRVLVVTHTHAACGAFATATKNASARVEIRTIDSIVVQIAAAYCKVLGLPSDPSSWQRTIGSDFLDVLGIRVAEFLDKSKLVARALADRYPHVVVDEHQDSTDAQHAILLSLYAAGSRVRIFGDPMQQIYGVKTNKEFETRLNRWNRLRATARKAELTNPYRWKGYAPELGAWILRARTTLSEGGCIDLSQSSIAGLTVVAVSNLSQTRSGFSLSRDERAPIDRLVRTMSPLLVLTGTNETAQSLRAFWNRRLPIWEGHAREPLGKLVKAIKGAGGCAVAVGEATTQFLQAIAVGFGDSTHGHRLIRELREQCGKNARGKPLQLQRLARMILEKPNHSGMSDCLEGLKALMDKNEAGFDQIHVDHTHEFRDAIRLRDFEDPEVGLVEIQRRRSVLRPMPPSTCISTIHKSKGLECEHVFVVPCDSQFSNTKYARAKFYVALSRARKSLTLAISRDAPSPLVRL